MASIFLTYAILEAACGSENNIPSKGGSCVIFSGGTLFSYRNNLTLRISLRNPKEILMEKMDELTKNLFSPPLTQLKLN